MFFPFEEGINEANTSEKIEVWESHLSTHNYKSYSSGFHFFKDKKAAEQAYNPEKLKVIKCIVKKSWITAVGEQHMTGTKSTVIVAKKAIFPKCRGRR